MTIAGSAEAGPVFFRSVFSEFCKRSYRAKYCIDSNGYESDLVDVPEV